MYFAAIVGPIADYLGCSRVMVHDFLKLYLLKRLGFDSTKALNTEMWVRYINVVRDWWWWDIHCGDVLFILPVAWELSDSEQIDGSVRYD